MLLSMCAVSCTHLGGEWLQLHATKFLVIPSADSTPYVQTQRCMLLTSQIFCMLPSHSCPIPLSCVNAFAPHPHCTCAPLPLPPPPPSGCLMGCLHLPDHGNCCRISCCWSMTRACTRHCVVAAVMHHDILPKESNQGASVSFNAVQVEAVNAVEPGLMQDAQRFFVLTQTDNLWKEHLQAIKFLQQVGSSPHCLLCNNTCIRIGIKCTAMQSFFMTALQLLHVLKCQCTQSWYAWVSTLLDPSVQKPSTVSQGSSCSHLKKVVYLKIVQVMLNFCVLMPSELGCQYASLSNFSTQLPYHDRW